MSILDWFRKKVKYEEIDVFDPEYVDIIQARAMTYTEYKDNKRKMEILHKLEQLKKRGKK